MISSLIFCLVPSCILLLPFSGAQSFLGVNYGEVANNLPSPLATAKLLQSTTIQKVRLYGANPDIIRALANTGIGIVIGASSGEIPSLASDPNYAPNWVQSNVLPFYPASRIILITVGNEVLLSNDAALISSLLPAMQNLEKALAAVSLSTKIKVSTVHSMAILSQSDPPSSGQFNGAITATMKALLEFQRDNGSPLAVNPYPFFAYQSDPRPDTLAFCLFQPNAGRRDGGNGILYTNMFDAQVDAVRSALNSIGFKDIEIIVAETGWPYNGDGGEIGPSVENAKVYNGNLIAHLRSMRGTPLMPGKSVDTYLFALYDENLKPGPASERAFGLFKPDLSRVYDAGLSKTTVSQNPGPRAGTATTQRRTWCVPKAGVSDAQLQSSLDYACSQSIDCGPLQPGAACFEPNTVSSHAAFAMNLYYQTFGKNSWNCDFSATAMLTSTDPSYNGCKYAGS